MDEKQHIILRCTYIFGFWKKSFKSKDINYILEQKFVFPYCFCL